MPESIPPRRNPRRASRRNTPGFSRTFSATIGRSSRGTTVVNDGSLVFKAKKKRHDEGRIRIYDANIYIPSVFETKKKFISCIINGRAPSRTVSIKKACSLIKQSDKDAGNLYFLKMFIRKNSNKFDYLNYLMVYKTSNKKSNKANWMDQEDVQYGELPVTPPRRRPSVEEMNEVARMVERGSVSGHEAAIMLGIE